MSLDGFQAASSALISLQKNGHANRHAAAMEKSEERQNPIVTL